MSRDQGGDRDEALWAAELPVSEHTGRDSNPGLSLGRRSNDHLSHLDGYHCNDGRRGRNVFCFPALGALAHRIGTPETARAITSRWISLVPSKMV
ncbi:hypothetical protein GCM10010219_15250 [Streptomyces netropsis]|nr:hypothetical protein GCM10010219_15250 [Streptomyces netropsis]